MLKLLIVATIAGLLGAVVGAVAVYILAGGLPEGAIMGAILGGSAGILIAARWDARQSDKALARTDPEAVRRSAALRFSRKGRIREFHRDASHVAPGINPLKKLDDYASDAERGGHDAKDRAP